MSSSSAKNKILQIVHDGIIKSLEIMVSCHDKNCSPRVQPGENYTNNLAYIKKHTRDLERNIHIPFTLDVYLDVDNNNGISSLLIERWKIHYEVKKRETKEERASSVNKHIGIMMRTLYCYVRLLPSFQLSTKSKDCPISFKIHVSDLTIDENDRFVAKTSSYRLPVIPTPSGNLSIRLRYIEANDIKSIYDMSDRMYKLDALHAYRNTGQELGEPGDDPRARHIQAMPNDVYRGRRHSVSHEPIPIPHQQQNIGGGAQHQRAATALRIGTPPGQGISHASYSGGLRSPTQPSSSLVDFSDQASKKDQSSLLRDVPDMPQLVRHQSKSWTAETPLTSTPDGKDVDPNSESGLLRQRQREHSGDRQAGDYSGSTRTRSMSKGDKGSVSSVGDDRRSSRQGRPPQHPDGASSLTSSLGGGGTPPHYYSNGSTPSAPFFIPPSHSPSTQSDPIQNLAGGGYSNSVGSGPHEYLPQSISASPPFHCPSTNLLSTSPSTTVLGGIGLGSTMQNMRDYFIAGGGNRPRTLSGEKCYANQSSHKFHTSNQSNTGNDMLLLSELPVSPFDNALNLMQQGGSVGGDHDERSVNTGTITEGDKGNADTDEMFEFEDTDALDDDDIVEDMPFAWAQQSAADSYVFNKAGISHMPDVSTDGSMGGLNNYSGSGAGNSSSSNGMVNLNQSFIAQQCMAPPMLTSFRQSSDEDRFTHYTQDMGGSMNIGFQKLDQLKQFQRSYTASTESPSQQQKP
mmetsp:Transcript_14505/g.24071  ORF Transcript_14505/g.24071 Transcript_14505/m.24071 type:complete len:742 (+) Transcript_14505:277-2502(+)